MVLPFTRTAAGALPCLHLGMPKTATTCIQQHLFARHSQIEYLGKLLTSPHSGNEYLHAAVRAMNAHLTGNGDAPPEGRCRRQLGRLVRPALAAGRVPVWSREGNTFGSRRQKERQAGLLRRMWGPSRVLIFIRHPLTFVESIYFQKLKSFQMLKPAHAALTDRVGELPRYFDIETWLEVMWSLPPKGAMTHLLCADTANAYAAEFGRQNVHLFLFEQFAEDPPEVIRSMCRFIGIDAEEGVALLDGQRANDRWTVEQIERLKAIEGSPSESLRFRQGTWRDRRRMLGLEGPVPTAGTPRARAEIPPMWQERILQFAREDHRRLVDEWGLPLERYGYLTQSAARAA